MSTKDRSLPDAANRNGETAQTCSPCLIEDLPLIVRAFATFYTYVENPDISQQPQVKPKDVLYNMEIRVIEVHVPTAVADRSNATTDNAWYGLRT